MVFRSARQRKFCFAQYKRDLIRGKHPSWNCFAFARGLPNKKERGRVPQKIRIGPRGGRYILYAGRKIYVK